jgi:hypothetical protein
MNSARKLAFLDASYLAPGACAPCSLSLTPSQRLVREEGVIVKGEAKGSPLASCVPSRY